ncbi:hypothetical protein C8R44DRAFT_750554 [Mycena epipterygia]|nr:hypothetical protein C8R44DRAFT_750554 [Mycena epipterygia]
MKPDAAPMESSKTTGERQIKSTRLTTSSKRRTVSPGCAILARSLWCVQGGDGRTAVDNILCAGRTSEAMQQNGRCGEPEREARLQAQNCRVVAGAGHGDREETSRPQRPSYELAREVINKQIHVARLELRYLQIAAENAVPKELSNHKDAKYETTLIEFSHIDGKFLKRKEETIALFPRRGI